MSCLFDSLGQELKLSGEQVRDAVCNYLKTDPVLIEDLKFSSIVQYEDSSPSLGQYVEKMSHSSVYGGAVEIQAACCIWNRACTVSYGNYKIKFVPISPGSSNPENSSPIELKWYSGGGGHYTAA